MKKNTVKNIISWALVLVLTVIVFFWKKELIIKAFSEIANMRLVPILLCFLFSFGYVFFDGLATQTFSGISFWGGQKSAMFCSFYKLITLGSGAGVAEVYFLSTQGVKAEKGTGVMMIQYAVHKTVVTFLGLISFLILYCKNVEKVHQFSILIIVCSILSLLTVSVLIMIAVSRRITAFFIKLIRAILKRHPEKADEFSEKLVAFNVCGKELVKDKKAIVLTFLIDILKMLCWYAIPMVIFKSRLDCSAFYCLLMMGLIIMLSGSMFMPAGVGTLEYLFSIFFSQNFGVIAATAVILYRFFSMIVPFVLGIPFAATLPRKKD
ncbi:MAG: flippase-like domain-containing protein [Treponemataceae bacterium]|nr:flippase-like domain-containing protein [Treponemataceae bacterium]